MYATPTTQSYDTVPFLKDISYSHQSLPDRAMTPPKFYPGTN